MIELEPRRTGRRHRVRERGLHIELRGRRNITMFTVPKVSWKFDRIGPVRMVLKKDGMSLEVDVT